MYVILCRQCYVCIVMFCFVLLCIVLYCYLLLCIVMYCDVLLCIVMYCYVLFCNVMYCYVLSCIVMDCYALLCIVMYCYVLWCMYVCMYLFIYSNTSWTHIGPKSRGRSQFQMNYRFLSHQTMWNWDIQLGSLTIAPQNSLYLRKSILRIFQWFQ